MKVKRVSFHMPIAWLLVVATPLVAWPRLPDRTEEPSEPVAAAHSQIYQDAQQALDIGDWAGAADLFGHVAEQGGRDADAALYWQAWAQHKNGRSAIALQTVRRLQSRYPESSWVDDARALQVEIDSQSAAEWSGDEVDEELKLYALNSLLMVEPERAMPILEKYLRGEYSTALKERALFVLSQTEAPAARALLAQIASGNDDPALAMAALSYLGLDQSPETAARLEEIYRSTEDRRVKMRVLESLALGDHKEQVLAAARQEQDPQLRGKAIELLGVMDAVPELRQLMTTESSPELRARILEALAIAGDIDALVEAASNDSDPALRARAIEGLSIVGSPEASRALTTIYGSATDPGVKAKIIEAYMIDGNTEALIEIVETETDRQLRQRALEVLSVMDSEAAAEYLLEVLER